MRLIALPTQRPLTILLCCIFSLLTLTACNKPTLIKEWEDSSQLKEAAEAGNTEAQYHLGISYTHGRGVLQNHRTAVEWFQKAAHAGHTDAQFMLGAACSSGRGTERNQAAAINWYNKAAKDGHMRAQYQLGNAYVNGQGVTKDHAWGARWYGMAASQGHKEAQFYLGALYNGGVGLPKSSAKAAFWLRRSEINQYEPASKALRKLKQEMVASQYQNALGKADRWQPASKMVGLHNKPSVTFAQHVLNKLGFKAGFPDGIKGPQTEQAINDYLSTRGLAGSASFTQVITELRKESPTL